MRHLHYLTDMDIDLFRDLDRLDSTGNFSQAAELSHVSQPAFSRRIRSLETWVGVELVDRSRQPVKLTDAGSQMLESGLQALARIERARSQVLANRSLPDRYVVTFGAQHSIGWRFYPAWLQAFEEAYGPILTRLRADDLPICMRDMKKGEVDFVIAFSDVEPAPASPEQTDSIVIGRDKLIPVCKPDNWGKPIYRFTEHGGPVPFLRFGDTAPIGRHLEPMFRGTGLPERLRTVYENSMAGALRIRARDGAGVAWLPQSLVAPDIASGLLVRTGSADWTVDLDIRLLRDHARSNRLTRSIWSFLESGQTLALSGDV